MDEIYNNVAEIYDDLARVRTAFDADIDRLHYRYLLRNEEVSRPDLEQRHLSCSLRGRHIALLMKEIERWES